MPESVAPVDADLAPRFASKMWRAGTLAISRGTGMAAQMAVQIAVGALAGPAGIGTLQLHMAWGSLLGELVGAGEPTRALRDHSINSNKGLAVARGLRRASKNILAYAAALTTFVAILVFSGLAQTLGLTAGPLLTSILVSAPLFALTRLFAETLKALDKAMWAVTLENTVMPLMILGLCGFIALGVIGVSQTAILASAVAGLLLGLILMTISLRQQCIKTDTHSGTNTATVGSPIAVRGESMHFWLNGLLNIAFLQLPFLIMPWLVSVEDIGRYAVAHKLLNVITTLLILLSAVYGPRFARAAAAADSQELRSLLISTQRISMAIFMPAALLMLALAEPLAQLFSISPGGLLPLLLLLCGGQLLNAATGLSGVLLNMSGAAHLEFRLLIASCTATTFIAVPLGLLFGANGIAAAIAGGITLRNVSSYLAARRHIHKLGFEKP